MDQPGHHAANDLDPPTFHTMPGQEGLRWNNQSKEITPADANKVKQEVAKAKAIMVNARRQSKDGNPDFVKCEYRKAIMLLEEAVILEPEGKNTLMVLGIAYGESGETAHALKMFSKCIKIAPRDPEVRLNCAVALGETGNWSAAAVEYQAALSLHHWTLGCDIPANRVATVADINRNLALALSSMGDDGNRSEAAERHFKEAVRMQPQDFTNHYALGSFLANRNRVNEATASLVQVLQLNPSHSGARAALEALHPGMDVEAIKARTGKAGPQGAIRFAQLQLRMTSRGVSFLRPL